MRVFATYSIKGGVGKTATAVNLAYLSAQDGTRTLVWDLDPQGAATFYFRVKPKVKGAGRRLIRGKVPLLDAVRGTDHEGLDLVPSDFRYRHMDLVLDSTKRPVRQLARLLAPVRKEYDHVFLDCAPSISLVSESVFRAADVLLVPTIPTTLSLRTLDQLHRSLAELSPGRILVLPFFCMTDCRKSLHREVMAARADAPYPFLETEIPYASLVERMGVRRAPLHTFSRRSVPARAFRGLWTEVKKRVAEADRAG